MTQTILPPRFEDRGAELEATFPVIPVYEEVSGSLRPTWIPVDPTTFIPPAPKKSRGKTWLLATSLGLLTWGVGFAAVVGGHTIELRYAHASSAAAPHRSEPTPVAATSQPAPSVASIATSDAKPVGDSGIMLTIDVNDLPVIKPGKGRAKRGRAGS